MGAIVLGLVELFLLAVGLSMDAFAVATCKGLAMERISVKNVCLVGLWFGGFQALMPALGFLLAIVLMAGVRERLESSKIPACMKGFPISLVSAGLMAIAFMGFSGLV